MRGEYGLPANPSYIAQLHSPLSSVAQDLLRNKDNLIARARKVQRGNDELKQTSVLATWLDVLDREQAEAALRAMQVTELSEGDVLVSPGAKPDCWIGVVSGLLKVTSYEPDPLRSAAYEGAITPGGWIGEDSILTHRHWEFGLTAAVPTVVVTLPANHLEDLLNSQPAMAQFMLLLQAQRLQAMSERLSRVRGRVRADCVIGVALANMCLPQILHPRGGRVELTQAGLGSLLGFSRQRINYALQILERLNLLTINYGAIRIPDAHLLLSRAQSLPAAISSIATASH